MQLLIPARVTQHRVPVMAVRQRLHVPRGIYYVVYRGNSGRPVFSRPEDYDLFECLLAAALSRTGARAHAYCWTPESIHLALQIDEVPVGRVLQRATSQYARTVQQRCGESGQLFKHRYSSVVIDADAYLLRLIHYIHYIPLNAGCATMVDDYPRSSHRAYLGLTTTPWLVTQVAMRRLGRCREEACHAYAELMASFPSAEDALLFEHGGPDDRRVVADRGFLARLPRPARIYRSPTLLDHLINTAAATLGIDREHILSRSRQREVVFARALITWHATERGFASLAETGRRLRRDPCSLSAAVDRYRIRRPELFKLSALPDLMLLGSGTQCNRDSRGRGASAEAPYAAPLKVQIPRKVPETGCALPLELKRR